MYKTTLENGIVAVMAEESKWLTDGNTISKLIYLGCEDSPDDWREISDEEKNTILAQREATRPALDSIFSNNNLK